MTEERAYRSPEAFRRALTDRLRELAERSRWSLPQLQRQFAYDRLLARLYAADQDWVLKGAAALLARDIGVRATVDVDVYRDRDRAMADSDLRRAVARELGDWFRFELGPSRPLGDTPGLRVPVKAYVGAAIWVAFHIDLVGSDVRMTGQAEDVAPLAQVSMPDLVQHGYRAYPLADHVADKVMAIVQRYGDRELPSTRYRDLVDLVAIATTASVAADAVSSALASEAQRRGLRLPDEFDVPDRQLWERGYAAEAARSLLPGALELDAALALVRPFVDPILAGSARGAWDPAAGRWTG
jgi:Nucleotidyl transferase AbiEii toxin, Type IV TA system